MKRMRVLLPVVVSVLVMFVSVALAAYQHAGDADTDAKLFRDAYPGKAGTKLDNCALCHGGGQDPTTTKKSILGSCQYCHALSGYNKAFKMYSSTLNTYGKDYLHNGRSAAALKTIEPLDSDGDGYSNLVEINATRYPGDKNDDPSKVTAPYRIFTKEQLQKMPQHKEFLLMNTTKSGDYYAEYSGVIMEDLLKRAGIRADATKITAYAPDGYAIGHPLNDDANNTGKTYAPYVNGTYPQASYFYNSVADKAYTGGWVDYSSPGNNGRTIGSPIVVEGGLRLILALQADGKDLVPGYLDPTNKLASGTEGPFRTITPQKFVGPPDQPSNNSKPALIWSYDANADHNAGFSTKSATVIRVEPLPAGTTDIDVLEAGWNYVDSGKIVVYGDIDPVPNVLEKLTEVAATIRSADRDDLKHRGQRIALLAMIDAARWQIARGHYQAGMHILEHDILPRTDSCGQGDKYGCGDWIVDCDLQNKVYWEIKEIITLLGIVV